MKTFTIASVAALASVATAQLGNIPSCALNCFAGPFANDGCSSLTDFACHCKKGASLLSSVLPCVQAACSAADQAASAAAVQSICQQAGAPISIPNVPGATSSAAPASANSAVQSSSVAQAASSAAASAVSSAAQAASSVIASVASSIAQAASSAASATASASVHAASHSSSMRPTSASPSVAAFTGAASQPNQAFGLFGAAALAMLAL